MPPAPRAVPTPEIAHRGVFWLLILFFVLEYARPPGLPALRLQAVLIVVLPLLWMASRDRPWSPILTLQLLYFLIGGAMVVLAYNYFSVYIATRVMYGNLAIAISLVWVLRSWTYLPRTLWIWLGIMCYQALYGLTHGGRGSGGFLGDENDLALACVTALPLGLVGFRDFRGRARWGSLLAAALLLAGIVASFSRGGFIGLVGVLGYLLMVSKNRLRMLLIGGLAGLGLLLFIPAEYKEEISSIRNTTGGTAEVRLFLWTAAFNMWTDNALLGVGPYNAMWQIGDYQPAPTESGLFDDPSYQDRNWSGTALHSLYFELLAERGIVGCVLVLAMVGLTYRTLGRVRRRFEGEPPATYAIALGGALTGVLTAGAFLSIATYPYIWYLPAMAAALEMAAPHWRGRAGEPEAAS